MGTRSSELPELPLADWERCKLTLHLLSQIVGKLRMASMPRRNHWWNVTLYVCPRGLTTGAMPFERGRQCYTVTLDLLRSRIEIETSRGEQRELGLGAGRSVADCYRWLFEQLAELGIQRRIVARPYDLPTDTPFAELHQQTAWQPEYVERFFSLLRWVDSVFGEFAGRFYGKTCPVHLYWHHMDLAVTRFSGRTAPPLPADRSVGDKDAYSHEVVSFGFWAGDENVRAPAFYSYTWPSPEGLDQRPLEPAAASWVDNNGSPMALLMYDALRTLDDPRAALLEFMESAYQAGAGLAGWDLEALRVPALSEL